MIDNISRKVMNLFGVYISLISHVSNEAKGSNCVYIDTSCCIFQRIIMLKSTAVFVSPLFVLVALQPFLGMIITSKLKLVYYTFNYHTQTSSVFPAQGTAHKVF